jgi:hypothetical protein
MSFPLFITLFVFILIFILRMPIALGMLASAACYLLVKGADLSLVVNQVMNTYYTNYVIIAVPLFIFTANVMNSGKVTDMIFKFAGGLTGRMRGARGQVNVLASLIFSGMTGSAIADAAGWERLDPGNEGRWVTIRIQLRHHRRSATSGPIFKPSFLGHLCHAPLQPGRSAVHGRHGSGASPRPLLMIYVAIVARSETNPEVKKIVWTTFSPSPSRRFPPADTCHPVVVIYTG